MRIVMRIIRRKTNTIKPGQFLWLNLNGMKFGGGDQTQ